jgi:pyruvate/2-oxoacid:ferredoxin oxidoreductase alpha subunit
MVGMTTRARVVEFAGIASTSTEVYWAYPISPSFPLFSYLELGRN